MNSKTAIRKHIFFILLLLVIICVSACQPTPEQDAVTGKDDLTDEINTTAAPTEVKNTNINTDDSWQYKKEYDSGNKLIVDAVLYNIETTVVPVISIAPKFFESGESIKKITELFCLDAKIFETGDTLTRQHLDKEILKLKEDIYRVEHNLLIDPNRPDFIVPEEKKSEYIVTFKEAIKYYEELLPTAPDESELKEASYQLVDRSPNGYQANMTAYTDNSVAYINFVNWDQDKTIGSIFMIDADESIYKGGTLAELVMTESLELDEEFLGIKEKTDEYVQAMGVDYMSLNMVTKTEESYTFYYTRYYNGLPESYVRRHLGTSVMDVDGSGIMMNLWDPEYIEITMYNSEVYEMEWCNPSRVIGIDNENVAIIGWEEAKEIFTDQMDYMLTADLEEGVKEIHINRIELGLVKLLMKDSESDYKLVPAWNFFGYCEDKKVKDAENGALICFMTINALDGSIVDRGWMY